jgi:hypothetical protein
LYDPNDRQYLLRRSLDKLAGVANAAFHRSCA